MPVRIYALAKDLNIDSKDLAEICKKVGLQGKGSALASLDDDEVQRVKDHLSAAKAKKQGAASGESRSAAVAPVKDKPADLTPTRGQGGDAMRRASRTIQTRRPKSESSGSQRSSSESERETSKSREGLSGRLPSRPSSPAPEAPAEEQPAAKAEKAPAEPPQVAEPSQVRESAPSAPAASKPKSDDSQSKAATPTGPSRSPVRSGGGISAGNKIRQLDHTSNKDKDKDSVGKAGKGRRPVIRLGQMPEAKQPTAPKPSAEAPAQKPEIRLTKDVIAGHKQGVTRPLEELQAREQQKDADRTTAKGGLSGFTGDKRRKRHGEADGEDRKKLLGMESTRPDRRNRSKRRANQRQEIDSAMGGGDGRRRRTLTRRGTNTAAPRKEKVVLELPCTLRSFSEAAGVQVNQVLRVLMGMGMMVNINATLDQETAEMLATELDLDIELKAMETLEEELINQIDSIEDDPSDLIARPPIVTFLGHVDHGKTSLLDRLIGINVVKGEAGGITQHIRAYQVGKDNRKVTFVDTPGHEAFTEMRARGANVTDIAVLVVAADDGIMPQTEEAISHAKAAEVPIVVALNKVDLEGVDLNRTLTQMTEHGLTPSEWGGDVEVVRTSAMTGDGMDELLETLLTVAELHEYQANPARKAVGVCLEAEQQGDRGVIAKMVVRNGTLRVGDVLVCGSAYGRVRALTDTLSKKAIQEAGPSTPVSVTGLDTPPGAGDQFHVLEDIGQAREIAENRLDHSRNAALAGNTTKVSFESFQSMMESGRLGPAEDQVRLNLIIRADARGSLEAIDKELSKIDHPEVDIRVLQRSVGGISVADVTLASASDAVILGFNVIPDEAARSMADQRGVEVRRYSVIYKLTDEIKAILEGRLRPEERVVELGRALVKQVFQISRSGTIAGSYVAQGVIERGCRIRVNRDGRTIGDYPLDSVRRMKEDVKEVPRGMECGIKLSGFNDIRQDDVLEAYKIEEVARTLD